jgi:ketosteroid isomerase-like protein
VTPAWLVAAILSASEPATDVACLHEISTVADAFDRAQIEKNGAALEQMVHDDLVFVDSDGIRQNKRQFIAAWLDPAVSFSPITVEDRYVVTLGEDSVVVGGDVVLRGAASGNPFASRIRFSDTFRRDGGCWKAIHIQSTRVKSQ